MRAIRAAVASADGSVGRILDVVEQFTAGVEAHLRDDVEALHANYWLSGLAGHRLKHALELPLAQDGPSKFKVIGRYWFTLVVLPPGSAGPGGR